MTQIENYLEWWILVTLIEYICVFLVKGSGDLNTQSRKHSEECVCFLVDLYQ